MLTMEETAKALHVTRPTVYAIMREGLLTATLANPARLRSPLLFRRDEVERILRVGRAELLRQMREQQGMVVSASA